MVLRLIMAMMALLTAVMLTGPHCLEMKGMKRFFAGFGIYAGITLLGNLIDIALHA
jgi:hypothetical protein